MDARLVSVIVDADIGDLRHAYTYRVPDGWTMPRIGQAVVVPFGGQTLLGFVVADETDKSSYSAPELADPPPGSPPDSPHVSPHVSPPAAPQDEGGSALSIREALRHQMRGTRPEIKPLVDLLDAEPFFDEQQWELARWMAERYYCSPRDSLRCIVPEAITAQVKRGVRLLPEVELSVLAPAQRAVAERLKALGGHATVESLRTSATPRPSAILKQLRERGVVAEQYIMRPSRVGPKRRKAWRLSDSRDGSDLAQRPATGLSPKQAAAVAALETAGRPLLQADLERLAGATPAVLAALERKGVAVSEALPVGRDPFGKTPPPGPAVTLTPDQRQALAAIEAGLAAPSGARFLLHGVTASGKTEVYLRALEACSAEGREGLLLVPEISLTAQMMDTVRARFGTRVAVLHSALSDGERYDEWMRIRGGEVAVVVGARSAVFAPLKRIGLVILDEEHETSYKQESTPRYHTRDVAARRAQLAGGVLVLGSATPSVETYYWSQKGVLKLLEMPSRIDSRPMPVVRIVDLRSPEGTPHIFSEELAAALEDRLTKKEQAILFLNRRGYATFVLCRDCGYTAMCPNCSVSLTFHASQRLLRCHHCDYHRRAPTQCPKCGSERIRHFGLGTEKLEEEARRLFPSARVLRMDRDTTTRKGSHRELLAAFRSGEADLLIGTQMVAKGLDFPRVTLVGVIAADTALNLPDFRAAERSFQLIAQVAGRAGRGRIPGEVIVQTFNPDHYSLQAAAAHDFARFYVQEIEHRQEAGLCYPPFSRLANLVSADPSREAAEERIRAVARALKQAMDAEGCPLDLLGPAPAPMERIKGRYRWHLVLKAPELRALNRVLRPALDALDRKARQGVIVDVDPVNLM